MHILFLTDNFPPEVNAPASRTFEHCKEWVKAGHKVTVITGVPNFPKGEVFKGYRNRLWQREQVDGIDIVRVWTYIAPNEGNSKRILDYISFMISAFLGSLFVSKPTLIIGTSPQFFTACAAYLVSIFRRVPWVFELRDFWPESIKVVGAISDGWIIRFLEKIEVYLYHKTSHIVAVTHSFKKILVERGIPEEKISVITNGVDTSRFVPQSKDCLLIDRHGLKEKFVIGYIGTIGLAHKLDVILDAAETLLQSELRDKVQFLILGDGAEKSRLKNRAIKSGLNNVTFLDSVEKKEVVNYWSILDVSIVHLKKDQLFKTVIPSKIFECMSMGVPILHGVQGESANIIVEHDVGFLFEPENFEELCGSIRKLYLNISLRDKFKKNGLIAAKSYNRAFLAKKFLNDLEKI